MNPESPSWRRAALAVLLGVMLAVSGLAVWLAHGEVAEPPTCAPPDPVWLPPRDFSIDFFGLTYSGNTSDLIDRTVFKRGAFEKHVLFFMADMVLELARPDAVYVDVGANVGQHVLFMAPRVAQVHAFEPFPPVLERLRQQVQRNNLRNVHVHPVGLGAGPAELTFHAPGEGNHGSGTFVSTAASAQGLTLHQVPVVAGDTVLLQAAEGSITLVKIDVEGYERPVLVGLQRVLRRDRPVLVVEVTPWSGESFSSARSLRAALPDGYRLASLTDPVGRESGYYMLSDDLAFGTSSHFEVVAYPEELSERVPRRNTDKDPYHLMQAFRVHERPNETCADARGSPPR